MSQEIYDYWYPWHPARFKAKTMHLTPEQDGIYRRLIDFYMETKQPLPESYVALSRIVGCSVEIIEENASSILDAFFEHKEGMYFHKTCNEILDDQDAHSRRRKRIASKAAKKRWSKVSENIEENASSMPEAMHKHATKQNKTKQNNVNKKTKAKKDTVQKPANVSDDTWKDFKKLRTAKKAPITQTVINIFDREAFKAGITLDQAMQISCMRGWTGFKAEWVLKDQNETDRTKQELWEWVNGQ